MSKGSVNVFDLQTKGQCSVAEKGGEVILKAGDPISAIQAVARQAGLQIGLTPEEAERLMKAGRLEISLRYTNTPSGATEAVKQIDRLSSAAVLAGRAGTDKRRSVWKTLGLLVLAVVIGAAIFAGTVVVLDSVYGSRILSPFLH